MKSFVVNVIRCRLGLLLVVMLALPAPLLAADDHQMSAAGCKTEHFMLKGLVSAYKQKTGNQVRLGRTGNKKAVEMLLGKQIDFAFTCKPISALSKKFGLDRKSIADWESVPIGKDPIIVISNYVNGVDSLSMEELTRVFKGEVKNWQELGGNDVPVKVGYMSEEIESGVVLLFREFTVGKKGALAADATRLDDPAKLGQFVYATPGGVSFLALNAYHGDNSKILQIDGIEPSRANIINGSYKLSATYYLTAPVKKNVLVADFIAFSQSTDGQQIVARDFVPYTRVAKAR